MTTSEPLPRIPSEFLDLVERPLFAHLATVRPDGTPQVNPMWFAFDDGAIKFSHTTYRQKFRNLAHHREVALSIIDPDDPGRYLEIRGRSEITPDPTGDFYRQLARRYGRVDPPPPSDAAERVLITVTITDVSWRRSGPSRAS